MPTVYECLGLEPPEEVKGYTQWPLEGTSFKYSFDDADAPCQKDTQYYVMLGTRGIWHEGWKADAMHPAAPGNWSHFTEDRWELYQHRCRPLRVPRPRRPAPREASRS